MRGAFTREPKYIAPIGITKIVWLCTSTFALTPTQQKHAESLREEIAELVDSGFSLSLKSVSSRKALPKPKVTVQIPPNMDDILTPIILVDEAAPLEEKITKPVTDRPSLLKRQPVNSYTASSRTDPNALCQELHEWYNKPINHVEITSLQNHS